MSTTEPPREGLGAPQPVPVFRGSQAACLEYALVLEAKGVPYERVESDGAWLLVVAPPLVQARADELRRYAGVALGAPGGRSIDGGIRGAWSARGIRLGRAARPP